MKLRHLSFERQIIIIIIIIIIMIIIILIKRILKKIAQYNAISDIQSSSVVPTKLNVLMKIRFCCENIYNKRKVMLLLNFLMIRNRREVFAELLRVRVRVCETLCALNTDSETLRILHVNFIIIIYHNNIIII